MDWRSKIMDTLATELLHELKKSSKRNFIIAIILLIALVGSNIAWLVYESQYSYEETTIDSGDGVTTYMENSNMGDINNGEDN